MIRHRPHGSGHPYQPSIDQRLPIRPLTGQRVNLGVAASRSVTAVRCEWDDGTRVQDFDLQRAPVPAATAGAEGHLATAAAGHPGRTMRWAVDSPPVTSPVRYRFVADTQTTAWFTLTPSVWSASGGTLTVTGRNHIVDDSVSWLADASGPHRVRFALRLSDTEHVVGFGERYDYLDQRGHTLDATVFEQYKGQGAASRTYLPMPFAHVLGGNGWAFFVDTAQRTWYDVGVHDPDRLWIEADLDGPLRIRFFDGSPGETLAAFLKTVGEPTELPDWVFRLWASGNEWNTQTRVLAEVDRHLRQDVPLGVVVIEAWSDETTFTAFRDAEYAVHPDGAPHRLADFTFSPDGAWPDPKGMVDRLHADGVRVVLWQIPLQKMRPHPTGQARADAATMTTRGYCVQTAHARPYRNRGWWFPLALMPDFTNPDARQWWLAKRRYLVDEMGIDGFKTDGGEHAWGHDLRYADGSVGVAGNNRYPVHYAAAYGDLLSSCGKAPLTFSRAGSIPIWARPGA